MLKYADVDAVLLLEKLRPSIVACTSEEQFLYVLNSAFKDQDVTWSVDTEEEADLLQGLTHLPGGHIDLILHKDIWTVLSSKGNKFEKWNMFISEVDSVLTHELRHRKQNPEGAEFDLLKSNDALMDLETKYEVEAHAESAHVEFQNDGWSDEDIIEAIHTKQWELLSEGSDSFNVYHEYLFEAPAWNSFLEQLTERVAQ